MVLNPKIVVCMPSSAREVQTTWVQKERHLMGSERQLSHTRAYAVQSSSPHAAGGQASAHHALIYLGFHGAQSVLCDHKSFCLAKYQDHQGYSSSTSTGLLPRNPLCSKNSCGPLCYMSSLSMTIYASINIIVCLELKVSSLKR